MKKYILLLLVYNFLFVGFTYSQIIAGSGSAGLYISDPSVNLSVSTIGNTVSEIFDLDCDSIADMQVDLYKGPTMIDGPNIAYLYVLNSAFEICADTGTTTLRNVYYFNLGDSLICPDSAYWSNDTVYKLGDFGCMDCMGPYSGSNLFIAYRNISTSQIGWIKISFDLFDSGGPTPITLTIPEILSPCLNTALPMAGGGMSGTATCGVFTYSYTITPPSCNGFCDGSIAITALSGGTPGYTYNWTPGSPVGDGTPMISYLCPGTYSVTFTDAVGNTCTASFILPNGPSINFSFITTNVSCFGTCDGTICVDGTTGGSPPYMYQWSDGSMASCITNVCAGTYTLCVTDGNGCQTCSTVVVSEPPPLVVTESVIDASCFSCCDGVVSITPSGGTAGYTYSWSSGCFGASCNSLCPGVYNYCVTDVNGCTSCDSMVVSFPLSDNNTELNNNLIIFPNPNIGDFEISNFSSKVAELEIKITDVNGKLIFSETEQTINQKLVISSSIENGMYFVYIRNKENGQIAVKKIIIQK